MILNRSGAGSLSISTTSLSDSSGDGTMQLTPKKLSIETKDQRRLVEYFVVVSSVLQTEDSSSVSEPSQKSEAAETPKTPSPEDHDCWNFVPVITSRYPLTDHEDSPLSDGVTDFCHPVGYVVPSDEFHMPKVIADYSIF